MTAITPPTVLKAEIESFPQIRQTLESGGVVLLPMATVYGLVVHGERSTAIDQLRQIKKFHYQQPLSVLTRLDRAEEVAKITPALAQMLPLFPTLITLIAPAHKHLDPLITLNFSSIFLSCPDRFIYDLVGAMPFPMVAGTAQIETSLMTNFTSAQRYFGSQVNLLIDGGDCIYGRRGTLIDCTLPHPTIMNFGPISVDDLRPQVPNIILPSHLMK